MSENSGDSVDLDYVLLAGVFAGTMTAVVTVTSLLMRPYLMELGRQLPLPGVNEVLFGKSDGDE